MRFRKGCDHTAVAFIRHGNDCPRFSDSDVGTGNPHFSAEEFRTHDASGRLDFFRDDRFFRLFRIRFKEVGNVFFRIMNSRHNHVGRRITSDGVDEFAQVRFLSRNACFFIVLVEVHFFRCHGFRLNAKFDVVVFCQFQSIVHSFFRRMSDEYVSPVGFRILDEFGHDFVQMVTSIGFYFMDFLTKCFKVISFVNSCTVARISCRKVLQRLLQRRIIHGALDFLLQ